MNPLYKRMGPSRGAGPSDQKEGLVPRTVYQTTGSRKELQIKGDDGSEFALVKHSKFLQLMSGSWTYELVQNPDQNADVTKLTLVKSGQWREKVTITDAKGQSMVELGGGKVFKWRFARKFAWGGREYQWEHSPNFLGDTRFFLTDLESKTVLAERTLSKWSWHNKGAITIFHAETEVVPTAWILATALATEQLWRDETRGKGNASNAGAVAAGASVSAG